VNGYGPDCEQRSFGYNRSRNGSRARASETFYSAPPECFNPRFTAKDDYVSPEQQRFLAVSLRTEAECSVTESNQKCLRTGRSEARGIDGRWRTWRLAVVPHPTGARGPRSMYPSGGREACRARLQLASVFAGGRQVLPDRELQGITFPCPGMRPNSPSIATAGD
jgi:hypothetical protein